MPNRVWSILTARRSGLKRGPGRGTFMEGFIDDYARVRLAVAIAALALVAGVVLTGGSIRVASLYTVGFMVVAIHAG